MPHQLPGPGTTIALSDVSDSRRSARLVIQSWLVSRGLIAMVGLLLAVFTGRSFTDLVGNWDVQHFTELSAGGYLARPDGTLMAFFPALPAIFRLGLELGVSVAVTGVALSVVGSAVAAAALYRLGGAWAATLWLFAPTAVFTMVPYTESLFCALAFWAWERARSDRWVAAAVLTAAACTVRVSGLFLIGALVVMILFPSGQPPGSPRRPPGLTTRGRLRRAAWLLLPTAVLAAFATYLFTLTGSWTAWLTAQSTGWVRELTWPWQSFLNTIPAIVPGAFPENPWWASVFRAEMVSMALGVVVTIWCLRKRLYAEASWVGVQVLAFSMSYWFFSVNRATLLWFPLWIMLAQLTAPTSATSGSNRARAVLRAALVVCSAVLMLGWTWLFFTGHWAS